MAIDFGTSYSTVTVYDPKLIDETIIDGNADALAAATCRSSRNNG